MLLVWRNFRNSFQEKEVDHKLSHLTFNQYIYYGVLIAALAVYLPMYIKIRKELDRNKLNSARWGVVASFAVIGVIAFLAKMVALIPALISAGIACLIAYYVVFVKYRD